MSTQQQTTVIESIVSNYNNDAVSTVEDMSDEICGIHINDQYIYQPRNGEWIWYVHKNNDDVQSVSIFFTSVSYDGEGDAFLKHDDATATIVRPDDFAETFNNLLKQIAENTA
jgi:hypothetical protein